MPIMSDLTQVLDSIETGNTKASERLLPLVYDDLRRIAKSKLSKENRNWTVQPTELVHEAWLRLNKNRDQNQWNSRGHFFAAAAESMRRILVERARKSGRIRHGGEFQRVDLAQVSLASEDSDNTLLAVHDALEKLEQESQESALVVKLRYFVGMGHQEIADVLNISEPTVRRRWAYSRAFLYAELKNI